MQTETLIYIILAAILALFIALFQYKYKTRNTSKLNNVFALLRFVTLFTLLLLIINPKLEQLEVYIEKPNLIVAVDNSNSIVHLNKNTDVKSIFESIVLNKDLNNKFNVYTYQFDEDLKPFDSLNFKGGQTNISKTFNQLGEIYKGTNAPTIVITDGNQTFGNDYEFIAKKYNQPIYPVIAGDTTNYIDLKIEQLNVNKYAYLKNSFPIEAILLYNGDDIVNSKLEIRSGNTKVYSKPIAFTKNNNSRIITTTLPANRVGVSSYKAYLVPIDNEKNKVNNTKNFAIEVIDQKTNIAIVSDFIHPDLGAFKKSIESNEQRSVALLNSTEATNQVHDFQLFICYQPNNKFKDLFEVLKTQNKNSLLVSGTKTDISFLNTIKNYNQELTNQFEEYQGALNTSYMPFLVEDINFESFPPLLSNFGAIKFSSPYQSILNKTLGGTKLEEPLLATFEKSGRREAVLFGEGIWKWRAQSFINTKSFNQFDDFIGKLVQYLASNKRRNRLNVEYESFYDGNTNIILKAQFFDKNYIFNSRELLNITLIDTNSKEKITFPFVLKNNNYQVDLSGLPASKYTFTVSTSNENISQSGNFEILEYNVEQQFLNANVTKLQGLATNSNGTSYFIEDKQTDLISNLLEDNRYVPIQKSNNNIIPLIDWKYLLVLLTFSLSIEWLLRKYNGLI